MGSATATALTPGLRGPALRLLSDARLAKRAAAGDRAAFALIFERHHQGIYRYCRSILANHDDASDALQNTMAAALRALAGERREIALKPWLYRIAHNESISLIRRRRQTAELGEDIATAAGPQQELEARERLAALVSDLGQLPVRQSGALVMRELNGLGYDEIAAALDISEAAAKQSVYHARLALQQLAEGRTMDCEAVQSALSGRDGRALRARRLRAHLRDCERCASFKAAFGERRADLSAIAPPIAPAAAAAVLDNVVGGGGAGGGGLLALLSGNAGKLAGGGVAAKASAAVGAALMIGAGAATLGVDVPGKGAREADTRGPDASLTVDDRAGAARTRRSASRRAGTQAGRRSKADGRREPAAGGKQGAGGERASDIPTTGGPNGSLPRGGGTGGDAAGTGQASDGNNSAPSSGPPAAGGPASQPGREAARQHAPQGLPAPAQQHLGGDGQVGTPTIPLPSAPTVPPSLPLPGGLAIPGR